MRNLDNCDYAENENNIYTSLKTPKLLKIKNYRLYYYLNVLTLFQANLISLAFKHSKIYKTKIITFSSFF